MNMGLPKYYAKCSVGHWSYLHLRWSSEEGTHCRFFDIWSYHWSFKLLVTLGSNSDTSLLLHSHQDCCQNVITCLSSDSTHVTVFVELTAKHEQGVLELLVSLWRVVRTPIWKFASFHPTSTQLVWQTMLDEPAIS